MYGHDELRPFTVTGNEIRLMVGQRLESIRDTLAALEGEQATTPEVQEYARSLREQSDDLAFLASHVREGEHHLTGDEMSRLRMNTKPLAKVTLKQRVSYNETNMGALAGIDRIGGRLF